ncbi:MAG: tRNA modification GTPase [Planctomycetota bacterium]|jgi:tRNA modification GTPase
MFDPADTIVAVSSARGGVRSIVRLTGPETLAVCRQVFTPSDAWKPTGILPGSVAIDGDLAVDGYLYLFVAPASYTGEPVAEIHLDAGQALVETLVQNLLTKGLRPAGPGEFTARAYLNGKLDLAQAEAVNEIIASSNRFQLDAAEKLLSGRLTQTAGAVRAALLDCLSLIEAGLDFSGEDITFITADQARQRLHGIRADLEELLAGSIRYESLIELPAVGIAGAPNAGKSSLLNALLGHERSIVSEQRKTTRDVLSGVWTTDRFQCVLFDCAGLLPAPEGILDELAQQAAVEALRHCQAILFCVDATKTDLAEDLAIRTFIESEAVLCVATKCDLPQAPTLPDRKSRLREAFAVEFTPISAQTRAGLDTLQRKVETRLLGPQSASGPSPLPGDGRDTIALTARHRHAVSEATNNVRQAARQIERGNEEVAAMMIRAACQAVSDIESQPVDEQILDRIFARFCIGK